jgi:uncharacterized protein YaiI (UPF0178 family)
MEDEHQNTHVQRVVFHDDVNVVEDVALAAVLVAYRETARVSGGDVLLAVQNRRRLTKRKKHKQSEETRMKRQRAEENEGMTEKKNRRG